MSNNDRPTEAAGTLVPTPSSAPQLRRSASRHNSLGKSQQGITPQFVLQVLRHWWMLATPVGLLLAGIAVGVVWWTFEPQYEATTWLRIKSQQPFLAFAPERGASDLFVQTQVEMIRSPLVLAPVIGQSGAAEVPELHEEDDPAGWLAKNIKVSPVGKSELFKISLACAKAKDSAWVVNAVAHEYLLLLGSGDAERTQDVIKTLQKEKGIRDEKVRQLRESLRELTKQVTGEYPISAVPTTNPNLHHPLADLNSRLITAEVEQMVLIANIAALEKQLVEERAEEQAMSSKELALLNEAVEQDPESLEWLTKLEDRESELSEEEAKDEPDCERLRNAIEEDEKLLADRRDRIKVRLAESAMSVGEFALLNEAVEQDPEIVGRMEQIRFSKEMLEERKSKLREERRENEPGCVELSHAIERDEDLLADHRIVVKSRIVARLAMSRAVQFQSRTAQLEEELAAMKFKLEGFEITSELLQARYDSKLDEAEIVSGDTLELHFMQDELARAEGVFTILSQRIERLTTEQGAPGRVKLLRAATPALVPIAEAPYTGIALASLLFFVPFGLAGAWEYLIRRVSNMQQLEESTNVTVIGEVARLPVRTKVASNGTQTRVDRDLTVFEESIDGLRTHLMLSEELMGMKVLAVTSAAEHEGKTSVAAQLALNIARVSGKRTLLIDGDMRSPDIHNFFDIPQGPGLAEILAGDCSLEDAIVRDEKNCTDVLPAGKLRTSPHRLLGNGALQSFMKEVRSTYDHIIIDTPPILAASEALVLARAADKSLMCTMKDSSRIDQVKKAHQRLVLAGGRPIGIVLNGVPTSHYVRQYGTYIYSRD